jgi:FKBP12-rapamycin complex-associated protein
LLKARAYQKLGEWQLNLESLGKDVIPQIIASFRAATECDTDWYKAWHSWALVNFEVVAHYEKTNQPGNAEKIAQHLIPAIKGFFRSISLSPAQVSIFGCFVSQNSEFARYTSTVNVVVQVCSTKGS